MEFDHFYCDEVEGAGTTIALRDEELRPDSLWARFIKTIWFLALIDT